MRTTGGGGRRLRPPRTLLVLLVGLLLTVTEVADASGRAPLLVSSANERPDCTATPHTLPVDGRARTYRLCLPGPGRHPSPLIVALHGLGGSGAQLLHQTGLAVAAERGVAVVAPDSVAGAWNDGRLGPFGPDDEHFVTALVRHLVATGVADPTRVTLTGFSNGADFSLVLASRQPAAFDAVVTMSGHLQAADGAARPTRPVPTYLMFGADDPIQPWNGRPARGRLRPALLSASATAQTFAQTNRATRSTSAEADGRTSGVRTVRYQAQADGAPVELIEVNGVGHVWPRRSFDATAVVLRVATAGVRLPAAPAALPARGVSPARG